MIEIFKSKLPVVGRFSLYLFTGFILVFALSWLLATTLLDFFPETDYHVNFLDKYSIKMQLFLVVVLGPLIETFLFQYLIISPIIYFDFKGNIIVAMILSSAAFALTHYYSWQYIIIMFFVGMVFAWCFVDARNRFRLGFLMVVLIHALYNGLVFILNQL